MCPGGTVVAATSEPQRVVTNGMSQYSRNERNANAGIVVGINPEQDFTGGPLAGVELQERLESLAFELGGSDYCAPGQLVGDFVRGTARGNWVTVEPSYQPGVRLGDLATSLPDYAIEAIREALPAFGKQIRGFDRDDAVLTGVETRTSSPLRITRDTRHCRASTCAACTRAVKVPAMQAASCRRVSTGSKLRKLSSGAVMLSGEQPESAHMKLDESRSCIRKNIGNNSGTSWWKANIWCWSCRKRRAESAAERMQALRVERTRALAQPV